MKEWTKLAAFTCLSPSSLSLGSGGALASRPGADAHHCLGLDRAFPGPVPGC